MSSGYLLIRETTSANTRSSFFPRTLVGALPGEGYEATRLSHVRYIGLAQRLCQDPLFDARPTVMRHSSAEQHHDEANPVCERQCDPQRGEQGPTVGGMAH